MDNVSITLKMNGVSLPVHPVFGDDVKLKVSREENQVFYRTKIDGKIKFVGDDFDIISDCSNEIEFELTVSRGASVIGTATFIKADCDLNYDDKVCTVKLTFTDRYEKFLSNYDNKYNLVKLAPVCEPLTLNKRPVLQFYFFGDTKITNSLGNMAFEVDAGSDAPNKTLAQLQNTYKFTRVFSYGDATIGMNASQVHYLNYQDINGAAGNYKVVFSSGSIQKLVKVGGVYEIRYYNYGMYWQLYKNGTLVTPYTEDSEGYRTSYPLHISIAETGTSIAISANTYEDTGEGESFYEKVGAGTGTERTIFCRMLSDYGGDYAGESKVDLRTVSDDVAEENYNYRYAWTVGWLNIGANMIVSSEVQDEPTEYGIDSNGKYFVKPTPLYENNPVYPIGWNMWIPLSFWFEDTLSIYGSMDISVFNTTYTLPDAYPLSSAIQVLLNKVDSDTLYTPNTDSAFFNEAGTEGPWAFIPAPPMRNAKLYITPITNVKKTRYEQAAQRGDITLKQILDMLRQVYNCYWYIGDDGHLKIEHITYFKNGNSYAIGSDNEMLNVATMKDMPNGLSWAYGQNELTYDRSKCPSRYEFSWADACTEQFNGYAIDIEDKVASVDKKDKASVSNFMADIDYCVISPNAVSDDLYVLIEANRTGTRSVQLASVDNGDNTTSYSLQNGYCSFLFAERHYLNYDLGGWLAKASDSYVNVGGTRKFAKQSINFPMPLANVGQIGIIKTEMGRGEIEDVEVNADTLYAKAKLFLENDFDYASQIIVTKTSSELVRFYDITNKSDIYLKVRVVFRSKSTGDVVLDTVQTLRPNQTYEPIYSVEHYDCTVISAKPIDDYYINFKGFVKRDGSGMTLSYDSYSFGYAEITFDDHHNESKRSWGYVALQCHKRTRINIIPSTKQNYDYGYVSPTPIVLNTKVTQLALGYASGTSQSETIIVNAGQTVFLGYVKDGSVVGNDDTVYFQIEVPEDD